MNKGYINRDSIGRYMQKDTKESVLPSVFGIVLLAVFVLVLNHFNAARLEAFNADQCARYGLNADCVTPLVESRN